MIPLRLLKVEEEYWDKELSGVGFVGEVEYYWVKKHRVSEKLQTLINGEWVYVPTETRMIKCSDKNPEEEEHDRALKKAIQDSNYRLQLLAAVRDVHSVQNELNNKKIG